MERFTDKVCIVTGAAQGIGAAIAKALVAEGGKVALLDINKSAVCALADSLGQNAAGFRCDVTDASEVRYVIGQVRSKWGRVDVLFNNAGIIGRTPFLEMSEQELDQNYRVNVKGCALMGQQVAHAMIEDGVKGAIVNTASVNGIAAAAGIPAYCATKGAVVMLTKSMALELAPYDIRVNAFAPTATETPMTEALRGNEEASAAFTKKLNTGRFAMPEEMAQVALFLASDQASFVDGAILLADGGLTSHV